jgi:hypothetical protein
LDKPVLYKISEAWWEELIRVEKGENLMKKAILVPVLIMLFAMLSCNILNRGVEEVIGQTVNLSGETSSEDRPVSGFTKVQLDGIGTLNITMGDTESLTVEADTNLLPHIITEVSGDTLIIRMQERVIPINMITDVTYTLNAKSLDSVKLSGLGDINVSPLQTDTMTVTQDGAGNITLDQLTADRLDATMSGLGSMTVSGKVTQQNVTLSGAGSYQAGDLESESATVELSGLGSATVWVTGSLDAELSGAGNLEYYGNPQVTQNDSGLGNINSLGTK